MKIIFLIFLYLVILRKKNIQKLSLNFSYLALHKVELFSTKIYEKQLYLKIGKTILFHAKLRLCLVTIFFFLFSKTCFWKYKEKTIFLYFLNQKHV